MVSKWECKSLIHASSGDEIKVNHSKVSVEKDALISITAKRDPAIVVYVKASAHHNLPGNNNAGISIHQSICTEIGFQSNDLVIVELIDKIAQCEIHMMEVTVLDQYLSRGDMWLFKKTFQNTCTYRKKKMDFSSITVTVLAMYDKEGNQKSSGYISEKTHCTFRSLSSYTQVFIQISKEMWEYDQEGTENWEHFEKVVYQFVKNLFDKWKANKANHDLQIIFFSRLHFPEGNFPKSKEDMIQYDVDGKSYLDIYDVICDGGNMTDLKPTSTTKAVGEEPKYEVVLRDMKRRFNKLDMIITQLQETHDAQISSSSKGNFLECINLALDQYSNHYKDRVHYRTGQQVLVITAGSGVFYVDRELAAFTKHRVLDLGVGADVVCLGRKPLHATPLFVLNKLSKAERNRFFDRYQVPHWMNMHFFTNYNNSSKFVPCLGIDPELCGSTDTLLPYRGPQPSFEAGDIPNMTMRKIEQMCDEYDSNLLNSHISSTGSLDYNYYVNNDDTPNSFSSDGDIIHSSRNNDGTLDRRRNHASNHYREANPFKPSDLPRPITNSRRRWAHVFPCAKSPQKTWHGLSRSLRIEQDPNAESVDWQSLIAPACFPTTTDYYPDSHYMYKPENYREYPNFFDSEDVTLDLQELFIQRLSRGYQLVLREGQKDQQPLYIFSLGDTYHEIKLQDNFKDNTGKINITIQIPEKKSQFPGQKKDYKYCLSPFLGKLDNIDDSLVKCRSVLTTRENLKFTPWNKFDNYILKIVGTDFEQPDVLHRDPPPWQTRYAILPKPDPFFIDHDVNVLSPDDQNVVYQFYNILLAMNNIKGQDFCGDSSKKNLSIANCIVSSSSISAPNSPSFHGTDEPFRPRTNTLVDSKAFSFSTSPAVHSTFSSASSVEEDAIKSATFQESVEKEKNSGYFNKFFQKSKSSDLTLEVQDFKDFRESITSADSSMKFISENNVGNVKQPPLPPYTFLAYSLIEWLLKNRMEIDTRKKAVEFCEELLKNKIIEQTVEKDEQLLFVDGFHFYSLKPEKPNKDKVKDTKDKIMFEVTTEASLERYKSNFVPYIPVEIEIQSNQKQNSRKEIFTVQHDSCYDPQNAYGLTVSWDKATAQLIETGYLFKWRNKADRFGFQCVQIPMNPFDKPANDESWCRMYRSHPSPFRAPLNIPVPSTSIPDIKKMLFTFGFLRDFPAGNFSSDNNCKQRVNNYVHLSGIAFVRIVLNTDTRSREASGSGFEFETNEKKDSAILEWASNPLLGSKKWYPKIFLPGSTKQENFSQMFFEELLIRFKKHVENYDFSSNVSESEN